MIWSLFKDKVDPKFWSSALFRVIKGSWASGVYGKLICPMAWGIQIHSCPTLSHVVFSPSPCDVYRSETLWHCSVNTKVRQHIRLLKQALPHYEESLEEMKNTHSACLYALHRIASGKLCQSKSASSCLYFVSKTLSSATKWNSTWERKLAPTAKLFHFYY